VGLKNKKEKTWKIIFELISIIILFFSLALLFSLGMTFITFKIFGVSAITFFMSIFYFFLSFYLVFWLEDLFNPPNCKKGKHKFNEAPIWVKEYRFRCRFCGKKSFKNY